MDDSAASRMEGTIRTISVGLMALAAMMVSFSVARQRSEPRRAEPQPASGRAHAPSPVNLDAIRSAGF
jgi:hypothetical protein